MLFTAGSQLPENPFIELVGRVSVPPTHIGAMGLNVGAAGGPTLTVMVADVAHCPDVGVKVYVVVVVLSTAGDQLPVTPFVDVPGSDIVPPEQIDEMALKAGVLFGFTVTVMDAVVAHCPDVGVKV